MGETSGSAMAHRIIFVGHEREPSLISEECHIPTISDGQILAKIRLATICGSDMHTIQGKRIEATPSVLGHEGVAEVIESRREGEDLKPGDRITFTIIDICNDCLFCQSNVPQKCRNLRKLGHLPLGVDGGFNGCYSSHIILERGVAVYKLDEKVSDRVAAPINCALATVVNAISEKPENVRQTGKALVQGAGLLGLYACAVLREEGFDHVYCTDIDKERLMMVHRFGGSPVYPGIGDAPDDNDVDLVIEVCGSPDVLAEGLRCIRPGGIYLLVGMVHPQSSLNITGECIIRKCLTIKGIHNYAPKHLKMAVDFITKTCEKYPYDTLLSAEYKLTEIEEAVAAAESRRYARVALKP